MSGPVIDANSYTRWRNYSFIYVPGKQVAAKRYKWHFVDGITGRRVPKWMMQRWW